MATLQKHSSADPDYAATAVPESARMNRTSLTMAWWALCSAMIWLLISATLAVNYGTVNTLIGLTLSVVIYGIINAVITRYAIKTGLSVGLFSRRVFGRTGDLLATALFFTIATYYAVFEGSVIAVAIHTYFPSIALWQAYLIVVIYSVPLVFGGVHLWMDKFNGVLLPGYLLGLVGAVLYAIDSYGYSSQWLQLGPSVEVSRDGWWHCFSYFLGLWVMMMYTWDYARFGKAEHANYHARFNFGMPFYFFTFLINGLVGIFLVATVPTQETLTETAIVFALLNLMGFLGLLFIWISQTRINTANFQLATVNLQALLMRATGSQFNKIHVAIAIGVIVFCLMLTDVFTFLLQALAIQSIFVVAWVVIALVHIGITSTPHHNLDDTVSPDDNTTGGLLAWSISALLGVVIISAVPEYASYASSITAVVAGGIYYFSNIAHRQFNATQIED